MWQEIAGGEGGSNVYWMNNATGAVRYTAPSDPGAGQWASSFGQANEFDNAAFYGATGSVGKMLTEAATLAGKAGFNFNRAAADAAPGYGWKLPGASGWQLGANDVQIYNNILDATGLDVFQSQKLDPAGASYRTAAAAGIQRDADLTAKNAADEGMTGGLLKAGLVIGGLIAGGTALAGTSFFSAAAPSAFGATEGLGMAGSFESLSAGAVQLAKNAAGLTNAANAVTKAAAGAAALTGAAAGHTSTSGLTGANAGNSFNTGQATAAPFDTSTTTAPAAAVLSGLPGWAIPAAITAAAVLVAVLMKGH